MCVARKKSKAPFWFSPPTFRSRARARLPTHAAKGSEGLEGRPAATTPSFSIAAAVPTEGRAVATPTEGRAVATPTEGAVARVMDRSASPSMFWPGAVVMASLLVHTLRRASLFTTWG